MNGGAWKYYKYDANGTYKLILPCGIATADISSAADGIILTNGIMRDDTWSISISADSVTTIYASGTAGAITATAPSTSGDEVVVIGFMIAANTLQLNIGYTWVEVK